MLQPAKPTLSLSERAVSSPFGLRGTNENALSLALGYTFQQCPDLLLWFLKQIGVDGVRRSALDKVHIHLQRHHRGETEAGITDVEIHLPGRFHVIIEAKIGLAIPSTEQCDKYLHRLEQTGEPIQKFVALVESGTPAKSKRVLPFEWMHFLSEAVRLMLDVSLDREAKAWVSTFYRFLDGEYQMKAFSTEVWIVAISREPLWSGGVSHWDIHQKYNVWWDYRERLVRPLYLALRVDGTLDSIRRVNQIEHDRPIIDVARELENVKAKDDWPNRLATIWHFDPPVPLPKPLKVGAGMKARRVRCDLDLLLTCGTVLEVEQEMGKRRSKRGVQ